MENVVEIIDADVDNVGHFTRRRGITAVVAMPPSSAAAKCTSFDITTLVRPGHPHAALTRTATATTTMEDADIGNNENNNTEERQRQRRQHLRSSLSFDDGFHHIPWADV